jgi:hypothetical protein
MKDTLTTGRRDARLRLEYGFHMKLYDEMMFKPKHEGLTAGGCGVKRQDSVTVNVDGEVDVLNR